METISHILWAETIIRKPDLFLPIAVASNLPDFIGGVPLGISMGKAFVKGFAGGGIKGIRKTYKNLPPPTEKQLHVYHLTHNIFAWGVFSLLIVIFFPRLLVLSVAYLSHLLVDIPTHGGEFGTRIFYPLSDWHVDSVNWINSRKVIAWNFILLGAINMMGLLFGGELTVMTLARLL